MSSKLFFLLCCGMLFQFLPFTALAQSPGAKDTVVTLAYFGNKNPYRDKAFLSKIKKQYGIHVSRIVDSLSKDRKFMQTMDAAFPKEGEFISSAYHVKVPIIYLGPVSDYEEIFTDLERKRLDSLLEASFKQNHVKIAVLGVDSAWTDQDHFPLLVETLHTRWGKRNRELKDGILIGLCKSLRLIYISTSPVIVPRLHDKTRSGIMEQIIIPEFRQDRYFEGLEKGIMAIRHSL